MLRGLFFSLWFLFHPVHVTLTSIEYLPETISLKVFVRLYFDDFLIDCRKNGTVIQDGNFSGKNPASTEILEKYLNEKMVLKVNDKQLVAELVDLKLADNELSMNILYKGASKPVTLVVKNLIMTDLYSDQANMVIVRVNDFEEGVKLTPDLTEKEFIIK